MRLSTILVSLFENKDTIELAHKLGLKSNGYGYWEDKAGNQVARTMGDRLVRLKPQNPPNVIPQSNSPTLSAASSIEEPELSRDAELAMTKFIGHSRDTDREAGIMDSDELERVLRENSPIAQEIEKMFAPVREQLRRQLGDKVILYRMQRRFDEPDKPSDRECLSWTANKDFALSWAGYQPPVYRVFSDEENYDGNYEAVEEVLGKPPYFTSEEQANAAAQKLKRHFPDIAVDKYDEGSPPQFPIVEKEIPLDNVLWYSNRANQHEFVVRNSGESELKVDDFVNNYVDYTGNLSRSANG